MTLDGMKDYCGTIHRAAVSLMLGIAASKMS